MHLTSIEQIDFVSLKKLFESTDYWQRIRKQRLTTIKPLQGRVLTNLFYEPSTRTASSFFAAASLLGASVNQITNVAFSSVSKGETFEDTIMTLAKYSDGIVLRHPQRGHADLAASISPVPIINAGDGDGEHPTQTLLDLYTIQMEMDRLEGLTIAMVGDLRFGRTIHSLIKALALYTSDTRFVFVSPDGLQVPDRFKLLLEDFEVYETDSLEEVLEETDVLYMTRVQKERFTSMDDYNKYHGCYELTMDNVKLMPEVSCILHPLPRVGEISPDVDKDHRAAYFRQVENGLFMRMAILDSLIS